MKSIAMSCHVYSDVYSVESGVDVYVDVMLRSMRVIMSGGVEWS